MIIVTGGAGFIGSALVAALNRRGRDDILIVDHLGSTEKWKNLVSLRYEDYCDKDRFIQALESGMYGNTVEAIIHMGACSATTERNADYLMDNNFKYTARLGLWWEQNPSCRFIYASSAATYGDGAQGYTDDISQVQTLRPLNMYGYSKQLFDCYALRRGWLKQMVGIKFFNVFGPNEFHKGDMRSLMNKAYPLLKKEGAISLFKSYRRGIADGEQKRDFIYIKDAVAMVLYFLDTPTVGGIFNVGTGIARSWNDVAKALFAALKLPVTINYIEMPELLKDKYQYFTEADTSRLRQVGCAHACMSLEASIHEYITEYLMLDRYL